MNNTDTANNTAHIKEETLRYLGHKGQRLEEDLEERIQRMIGRAQAVSDPRWVFGIYDIQDGPAPRIVLPNTEIRLKDTALVLRGKNIGMHLAGAVRCAVMAVTLGVAAERELARLQKESMTDALVFDAACDALVEEAADRCEAEVKALAAQDGLFTNFRFSPGYGDFGLEIQPVLLAALQAHKRIGLTAADSNLLIPQKSVTAVMAFLTEEPYYKKSGCAACNMAGNCSFERNGGCG